MSFKDVISSIGGILIFGIVIGSIADDYSIGIVSSVFFYLLVAIIGYLANIFNEYKLRNKKCVHGIKRAFQKPELCKKCSFRLEQENWINKQNDLLRLERNRITKLSLNNIEVLRKISPRKFESYIKTLFEDNGYIVRQTRYTGDGGKDIIMKKDNVKVIVECKRYSQSNKVSRPEIQKFHSAILDERAKFGYFVTTSDFTQGCKDYQFVRNEKIRLIGEFELSKLIISTYPPSTDGLTYAKTICIQCGEIQNQKFNSKTFCKNNHPLRVIKFDEYYKL